MADLVCVRNAQAPWEEFSPQDYWQRNYGEVQPEDQEIIRRVSDFFVRAFDDRPAARRAIDVGCGPNLYPALLMLPWTEQLFLTDHSEKNVNWLREHVAHSDGPWPWDPFWAEMSHLGGYRQAAEPRKQLKKALTSEPGFAGIEQYNVFDLPKAQWQLGTMFFVAESITEDVKEYHAAIGRFVGALEPGAPFAAAFMAGSEGYPVAGEWYPALGVTSDDVKKRFTEHGVSALSVTRTETRPGVRPGYTGMIVATGVVGGQ
jgi:NNMT/PNMT/TEMT family protein